MAREKIETPRDFPSIEELLQKRTLRSAVDALPRPVAAAIIKTVVASFKRKVKKGAESITSSTLVDEIERQLRYAKRKEIHRVINASGIVVHTNLGRAPLSEDLFDSVKECLTGYSNIEFDLVDGKRGVRGVACERYLAALSGAEDATLVNNCAAALFVVLNTLANRGRVIVSRGELVQIGGGFRIPDILKRSGARLAEVGTTNITRLADYRAEADNASMILKVHKSNFTQAGFTDEVDLKKLVGLGHRHGLPVVNDLGSGAVVSTARLLGYAEPSVQQSVRAGADLTCFSGDKLLGGVQAGLIIGSSDLIAKIKKNPVFRAVRVDKLVLAALERVLSSYLSGTYRSDIKLWSILGVSISELQRRAERVLKRLGKPTLIGIQPSRAFVGGGAMPESSLKSVALVFSSDLNPNHLMEKFRGSNPPVLGRIEDGRFLIDLKAVDESDLDTLAGIIKNVLG
ncbi:MAG: L-seryl-tRNA(Sec) selenium transferase [Candidatus Zixiibacteriota bacterium]|nr:MAG: L-seryl-tRNA(Sec) selenium transferase [candidate division Zixibacteria bacterium]